MAEGITPRDKDYSQWYLDVIAAADLAEHGPARGTMVIKPYGYAIWEAIQKYLDAKFKETGVENAYFPLLIPEHLLKREEKHVEGFSPEVAVVTHAGGAELEEPLVVRPTSETVMYEVFSKWIHSYRDLPLLLNQWANIVRWEMRPRLFMRTTEFLWQEGHTVHTTPEGADDRAREMLDIYEEFAREVMAIPVLKGVKSESEKFAGALKTYAVEAMMQDGKALQFATSHNLGENFAKAFDIQYTDENNAPRYASQTSWGLSTRTIGGLIMVHGDDKGLVLPPKIAPIKIVIIPIWKSDEDREKVLAYCQNLQGDMEAHVNGKIMLDGEDIRPGEKHYRWEKKGVPLRIEVGPKEVEAETMVLVKRTTGEKKEVSRREVEKVDDALENIQNEMYEAAAKRMQERTKEVDTYEEFKQAIEDGYFVSYPWDGSAETEAKIKEETKATVRVIPFDRKGDRAIFARSY